MLYRGTTVRHRILNNRKGKVVESGEDSVTVDFNGIGICKNQPVRLLEVIKVPAHLATGYGKHADFTIENCRHVDLEANSEKTAEDMQLRYSSAHGILLEAPIRVTDASRKKHGCEVTMRFEVNGTSVTVDSLPLWNDLVDEGLKIDKDGNAVMP